MILTQNYSKSMDKSQEREQSMKVVSVLKPK